MYPVFSGNIGVGPGQQLNMHVWWVGGGAVAPLLINHLPPAPHQTTGALLQHTCVISSDDVTEIKSDHNGIKSCEYSATASFNITTSS